VRWPSQLGLRAVAKDQILVIGGGGGPEEEDLAAFIKNLEQGLERRWTVHLYICKCGS